MRVAHILSGLDRRSGGVAAAVIGLAAAQARAGLSVSVLSSFLPGEDAGPAKTELEAAGVRVTLVGPAVRTLTAWHPKLRPTIHRLLERTDVVHVHALWEEAQHRAMRTARRHGIPYVVSPHGMLATWSLGQRSLKKQLYLALRLRANLDVATAIHFTTNEEAKQVAALGLKPPALVEALGLDLAEFATLPPAGSFRERYPELIGKPVALFMSRLHAKKGLDLLIPAFAKAAPAHARLVIAGPDEGGYEATVRKLVEQHGLTGRTTFTGMLKGRDRIAALADADVFVLPSYQENFGIVVPEALAAGTPAILSDQVNFAEHLAGQPFAQVVSCRVDAVADALKTWLGDGTPRAALSEAARTWTLARFGWPAIAERWVKHYERLVPSPGTPGEG